jgi:pimeloyl-ACP methyl ester carboxylesterase
MAMREGLAEVNGIRLWFRETEVGIGAPVLLLTGAGLTSLAWPDELLDGLTVAGRRVIVFDNRDIGLSTHIDYAQAPYALDDMAADTVGLLDALEVETAHLVGSSMGGMIIQIIAVRYPSRVRSLSLVITSPGFGDHRLPAPADKLNAILASGPPSVEQYADRRVDVHRMVAGRRFPFDEDFTVGMVARELQRGTNRFPAHMPAVSASPSRIDDLGKIGAPTLVVHGTDDPLIPFEHGRMLANGISGSKLVMWEGVGHELPRPLMGELSGLLADHFAAADEAAAGARSDVSPS